MTLLFSDDQLPEVDKDKAFRLMLDKLGHIDEVIALFQEDLAGQYEEAIRFFQGAFPERYEEGIQAFKEIIATFENEETEPDTVKSFHDWLSRPQTDGHIQPTVPLRADEAIYELLLKSELWRRKVVHGGTCA